MSWQSFCTFSSMHSHSHNTPTLRAPASFDRPLTPDPSSKGRLASSESSPRWSSFETRGCAFDPRFTDLERKDRSVFAWPGRMLGMCSFQPTCSGRDCGCVLRLYWSRKPQWRVIVASTTYNKPRTVSPPILFGSALLSAHQPMMTFPSEGPTGGVAKRQSKDAVRATVAPVDILISPSHFPMLDA